MAETSGIDAGTVRAALDYWSAYPDEVDAMIDAAEHAADAAKERLVRESRLLGTPETAASSPD